MTNAMGRWAAMVALGVALLAGCVGGPTGEVAMSVAALSGADVDRVEVTIAGPGISPPIVQELSRAGSEWRGAIGGIPAGSDRIATVVAYDASGTEIFRGDSAPFVVTGDDTVSVTVVLYPSGGATTTTENPPTIDSVVIAPGVLSPSQTASVTVTASDPDPGDTLTYAWTATGGTFADATAAATTYTAPPTEGTVTLTITVTDSQGSARTVSIDVPVSASNTRGTARITVTVNTWPTITRFAATPGLVPGLGTASTVITASDADGDPVTISYTQDCAGGSIDPDGTFHAPPAPAPGTEIACNLHATASDGHGGVGYATAVVYVGDEITGNHSPVIETSFASNWTAGPGDGVSFSVTASDPDGDALTYHWTATTGTLDGTPADGAATNHWTSAGATATITVRVTDARGAWVEHAFPVEGGWLHGYGSSGEDNVTQVAVGSDRIAVAISPGGPVAVGSHPSVTDERFTALVLMDLSGELIWDWEYPSSVRIQGLAIDAAGNVYVNGLFTGDLAIGYYTPTSALTHVVSNGLNDAFVVSYSPTRVMRWYRTFGSVANDSGGSIAIDEARNVVYVSGQQGNGVINLGSGPRSAPTSPDGFVVALSMSGAYVWDYVLGQSGPPGGGTSAPQIAIDPVTRDLILVGLVYGNTTMQPFGASFAYTAASTGGDGFILRVTAAGVPLWIQGYSNAAPYTGVGYVFFQTPIVSSAGNIFVAGRFQGGFRAQPYLGGFAAGAEGAYDVVLMSIDATANERWAIFIRGTDDEDAFLARASDGSLWVAASRGAISNAYRYGSASYYTLPPLVNGYDSLVARVSDPDTTAANLVDIVPLAGISDDYVQGIGMLNARDSVVIGRYHDSGLTAEGYTLTNHGGFDGFVWRHAGPAH